MGTIYEGGTVGRKCGSYAGRGEAVRGRLVALYIRYSWWVNHSKVLGCSEMLDIT